jgi:hypothetical protein
VGRLLSKLPFKCEPDFYYCVRVSLLSIGEVQAKVFACVFCADVTPCHHHYPHHGENTLQTSVPFEQMPPSKGFLSFLQDKTCFPQSSFLIQWGAQRTFFSEVNKWFKNVKVTKFCIFPPVASYQRKDCYCQITNNWWCILVNLLVWKI